MSLYDTKKMFQSVARYLDKPYEEININILADGYCKATDDKNDLNRDIYISALMLRFWYVIDKMYNQVKNLGYCREDCYDRLYDCIEAACYYRAWQKKDTNAQACINQVLAGRGVPAMVYEAKLQKNTVPMYTLDDEIDDDTEDCKLNTISDESITIFNDKAYDLIQDLINNNKIIEAIVADVIAYNDCEKHEAETVKELNDDGSIYKYQKQTSTFWPFQVVKKLNEINNHYTDYFCKTYTVKSDILKAAIDDLSKANNQKKYRILDKCIEAMKVYHESY